MSKIWIIGRFEFKKALQDRLFLVITLLFLILSIVSVYIGVTTKSVEMQTYQQVLDNLKAAGSLNIPDPPVISSLSMLKNLVNYIGIVGAVMAIFLGFDGISRERQDGTLSLILTRPVFRDQLLHGKILGAAMITASVLMITFVGNILLFSLITGVSPTLLEMLRLFLVILFGFLYLMSFYIASLFLSMQSFDSKFSFLLMMIIWLGVSFVIPQLADTQRTFVYNMNAAAQSVTKIATNTPLSDFIELFSPSVHFENLSFDLLQVNADSINLSLIEIFKLRALSILTMVFPGILILVASYIRFLRKEEKN